MPRMPILTGLGSRPGRELTGFRIGKLGQLRSEFSDVGCLSESIRKAVSYTPDQKNPSPTLTTTKPYLSRREFNSANLIEIYTLLRLPKIMVVLHCKPAFR